MSADHFWVQLMRSSAKNLRDAHRIRKCYETESSEIWNQFIFAIRSFMKIKTTNIFILFYFYLQNNIFLSWNLNMFYVWLFF